MVVQYFKVLVGLKVLIMFMLDLSRKSDFDQIYINYFIWVIGVIMLLKEMYGLFQIMVVIGYKYIQFFMVYLRVDKEEKIRMGYICSNFEVIL